MRALRPLLERKFVRDTLALQAGKLAGAGLTLLSALLVARLMGTEAFGEWALAQSFLVIWQSLNLTGIALSTSTRLAMAVGADDSAEVVNLLGLYIKVSIIWSVLLTGLLMLGGPTIAGLAYGGETRIGMLAAWLSLTVLPDALYNLVLISLQSRRLMQSVAVLQTVNVAVLLVCTVSALLISPTPEGMIGGRLAYSLSTMALAFGFYQRRRSGSSGVPFPPVKAVVRQIRTVPVGPYWRFGLANAIDKNIANLFTELPLQIVGVLAGKSAAGYLEVAYKAMTLPAMVSSAIFDNLQAVVPQAVGRQEYGRLWANFLRVLATLAGAAITFYAAFALVTPLAIPLLFGQRWTPAVPVIIVLTVYGALTTVGGIFGPLYRALGLMRQAVIIKAASLALVIPAAYLLLRNAELAAAQAGALAGAWTVNGVFALSILLTAWATLPVLRKRAHEHAGS